MKIQYRTNNSGGSYWLNKRHWDALVADGWRIHDNGYSREPHDATLDCESDGEDESFLEAVTRWERATGMNASDEGCNCCGPPHTFQLADDGPGWESYSGQSILMLKYPDGPTSLEDALKEIERLKAHIAGGRDD